MVGKTAKVLNFWTIFQEIERKLAKVAHFLSKSVQIGAKIMSNRTSHARIVMDTLSCIGALSKMSLKFRVRELLLEGKINQEQALRWVDRINRVSKLPWSHRVGMKY
jgi:hypothetical protein